MEEKHKTEYPFKYQEVELEEMEDLAKYYGYSPAKAVRLGANGYFFAKGFEATVLDIYNMEVRPSDTFVLSYQRSGTTWTQELVWLLQNDCDFKRSKSILLTTRFPFLESGSFLKVNLFPESIQAHNVASDRFIAEAMVANPKSLSMLSSPRFIKSHLPISLLPPSLLDTAKVVYVARDPRDVVVSVFFHLKCNYVIPNDREFKPFWMFFTQNKVTWCPYFEHVKEAWKQRNHPNMTFIFYEELSEDLPAVARRLATFFGKEYSDEQFQELCNHLDFENFKNNSSVNLEEWGDSGIMTRGFIRKGKVGGWQEHFDAEMTQQAEKWIADNLRDTDLRFPHFN